MENKEENKEHQEYLEDRFRGMVPVAFTIQKNYPKTTIMMEKDYDRVLDSWGGRGMLVEELQFEIGKRKNLHCHGIVWVLKKLVNMDINWKHKGFYITRKKIYNRVGWERYIRKDQE